MPARRTNGRCSIKRLCFAGYEPTLAGYVPKLVARSRSHVSPLLVSFDPKIRRDRIERRPFTSLPQPLASLPFPQTRRSGGRRGVVVDAEACLKAALAVAGPAVLLTLICRDANV